MLGGEGSKEKPDIGHLVRDFVLAEDVPRHHVGLLGLANVGDTPRKDGIAVVCAAIFGEKTDETLLRSVDSTSRSWSAHAGLTEKAGMVPVQVK